MKVVGPGDPGYDKDRQISNARFDYRPLAIYYCENAEEVATVIRKAHDSKKAVRIRSGGHQHEGMCTADGVLLIDLSSINSIDCRVGEGRVWIGAGASLTKVYVDLWNQGYLFSGGGCGDVHVGGLTQGGGWGPVARQFGLTCDSLVGVEMVTAKGAVVTISQDGGDEESALLWALRGGGGGNFGVVTKFCFRLVPWVHAVYTDVIIKWGDEDLPNEDSLDQLVLNWIQLFPRDVDTSLTTFMRVGVVESGGDRVVIGGRYLGAETQARETMARLLAGQPRPRSAEYPPSPTQHETMMATAEGSEPRLRELLGRRLATMPEYQPGPALLQRASAQGEPPVDLSETCLGIPIRHKISSGFARQQFDLTAVRALTSVIRNSRAIPGSRQYLSLHCLGGMIANYGNDSAFAFRDRTVLLQYQAWWQPDSPQLDGPCIKWIESFRQNMAPYTDGAFINFVDRDIALSEYYKGSMAQLIKVKRHWDPDDWLRFEMSIPSK
jgi:hypothetical protein